MNIVIDAFHTTFSSQHACDKREQLTIRPYWNMVVWTPVYLLDRVLGL